jgi:hypothetical protein
MNISSLLNKGGGFESHNFSWVKFSKASIGTATSAVPTGAEIRPVDWPNAARSGLFAQSSVAFQAAASRAIRSKL